MREVSFAWCVSAFLHVAVLGTLYYTSSAIMRDFTPPEALKTAEGRATIELAASSPSVQEFDPDKNAVVIVESAVPQPEKPRPLEPTKIEIKKQPAEAPAPRIKANPRIAPMELAAVTPVDLETKKADKSDVPEARESPTTQTAQIREPPKPLTKHNKERAEVTSPASIASQAIEGTDVDRPPQMLVNPTPPFPDGAIAGGRQGLVWLLVSVTPQGTVGAISVRNSSGYSDLDQSALTTVRRWRFRPATRHGISVGCDVMVPIRFTIR